MTPEPCIVANPDISGIGVRISVYIQSFLCFIPALCFASDGVLDYHEEEALYKISTQLILFSIGLLITTAVEQATKGIGNHHIILVLNMCWMINSSALVICLFHTKIKDGKTGSIDWSARYFRPRRKTELWGGLLVSANLIGMSILGIWLWHRRRLIKQDGVAPNDGCLDSIQSVFFFVKHYPLSDVAIQIVSLLFYSLMILPVVNVSICMFFTWLFSILIHALYPPQLNSALFGALLPERMEEPLATLG
ncbi:hypothetical protein V5O48_018792 [Marasmius crinis-equi]|uniref:Uncharacterized protein n=1 Tax=Marasmius crinis-equi TaxID=585013 RepID=A0ABR3EKC3_9AGAR